MSGEPGSSGKALKNASPTSQEGGSFGEEDAFGAFKISDRTALHESSQRFTCEMTGKSYAFYSYEVFNQKFNPRTSAMSEDDRRAAALGPHWMDKVPRVNLPIPLHILHHPVEKLSKATGTHALVLAPSTTVHHFPDLPPYDPSEAVLLFPTEDAVPLSEFSDEEFAKVKRVYVIDSTWTQARAIYTDPKVAAVRKITIAPQKTKFWRYQALGEQCLSSIEAIYYTYKVPLLKV